MKRSVMKAGLLAALVTAIGASPASGITVGQVGPNAASLVNCNQDFDGVQIAVSGGNSYTVPTTGGITNWIMTSWTTRANNAPVNVLTMKIWRHLGGLNYEAVSHDGPRPLTANSLNTFQVNQAVRAGDILGAYSVSQDVACVFDSGQPGDARAFRLGNLADGQSGAFNQSGFNTQRENVSAELTPTNTFTQGAISRNKKKGTATATYNVSNAGTLTATGTGVRASSARARSSATATAPGNVSIVIRASGKKKKKLRSKGKVGVSPTVTFTPNGGAPRSLALSLKLKKKRKK